MKKTLTGLDFKIQEMAGRIRELREISGFSAQTMALKQARAKKNIFAVRPGRATSTSLFSTAARWLLALTLQISSRAAAQSFDPIR